MALKRKRSTTLQSSPLSSTTSSSASDSSPIPSFYTTNKPITPMPYKSPWPPSPYTFEPSRTRKRHRDDRPAEATIHASTISRLYQAQREMRPSAEAMSMPQHQLHGGLPTQEQQRTTLHRFWRIDAPPSATLKQDVAMTGDFGTDGPRCEDCDGVLRSEDAMDLDGLSPEDKTCYSCRRHICDPCAVLGDERVCVACAHVGRMG